MTQTCHSKGESTNYYVYSREQDVAGQIVSPENAERAVGAQLFVLVPAHIVLFCQIITVTPGINGEVTEVTITGFSGLSISPQASLILHPSITNVGLSYQNWAYIGRCREHLVWQGIQLDDQSDWAGDQLVSHSVDWIENQSIKLDRSLLLASILKEALIFANVMISMTQWHWTQNQKCISKFPSDGFIYDFACILGYCQGWKGCDEGLISTSASELGFDPPKHLWLICVVLFCSFQGKFEESILRSESSSHQLRFSTTHYQIQPLEHASVELIGGYVTSLLRLFFLALISSLWK